MLYLISCIDRHNVKLRIQTEMASIAHKRYENIRLRRKLRVDWAHTAEDARAMILERRNLDT